MHTVIIGGGIIGTALAAELGKRDMDVTLLERDELGGGTTAASAAVFTWQDAHPSRFVYGLKEHAWETYRPLVEDGTLSFERVGALSVAKTTEFADQLREAAETLRSYGLDATAINADVLAEYDIRPAAVQGGLYTPEEGYFDPEEIVAVFAERAEARGATIRTEALATDIRTCSDGTDDRVTGVETTDGTLPADAVINAAGPWAAAVNTMVGIDAPLRHTYGPILVLDASRAVELPFTLFESKQYLRPVGSTGAFAGRYETDYENGETFDLDDPPAVEAAFYEEIDDLLTSAVPPLADATVTDEWVGFRTVTPDGLPIVGETDVKGFFLACGMCGLGVTLAPVIADLLCERLVGNSPDTLDRLAPGRF
ncbi:MAG TPA: FAD-dependent oxidoreductase [Halococcus sp.]|nr:FAD-dependent oxidoreductase [Halococcus sp.]